LHPECGILSSKEQQHDNTYIKESDIMTLTNDDLQAIASLMDTKLQPINNRLEKLESEMSAMRVGQLELKKEIREVKHKVNDTYELALDAWGKSTENRVWLESIETTS
jgi:hypothetical protein